MYGNDLSSIYQGIQRTPSLVDQLQMLLKAINSSIDDVGAVCCTINNQSKAVSEQVVTALRSIQYSNDQSALDAQEMAYYVTKIHHFLTSFSSSKDEKKLRWLLRHKRIKF